MRQPGKVVPRAVTIRTWALAALTLIATAKCTFEPADIQHEQAESPGAAALIDSAPDIGVDVGMKYQTIDGFGGALPMWTVSASGMLTTAEVRTLVGMGDQELGLSILRTQIGYQSDTWPHAVANLKEAKSYGSDVKILASPWSAPPAMKTNNSSTQGGKLKADFYDDYAGHLNGYVQFMKSQGVEIDVTSVQNEPDWHPDYDSMDWTGEELRNFVRDQGPKVKNTKLMVAEALGFNRKYTDPTLLDPIARNNIGYVGGHNYGGVNAGGLSPYPLAAQYGKNQWMTEWNLHAADGDGSNIWGDAGNEKVWDETLDDIMLSVHKAMESNFSAYLWWYARRFYSFIGDGEAQFGTTKGAILRRGHAFSQYAKFVRPGFRRVRLTKSAKASGLEATAYAGGRTIALVILNRTRSALSEVTVEVPGNLGTAQHFTTSQAQGRARQPVSITGQRVSVTIAPRSISTLVILQ